jgi:hypothetical protein
MSSKDTKQLIRRLRSQGWLIWLAGSGHYRARNPATGATVTLSATPCGGKRAALNDRAWLRKAGADL